MEREEDGVRKVFFALFATVLFSFFVKRFEALHNALIGYVHCFYYLTSVTFECNLQLSI